MKLNDQPLSAGLYLVATPIGAARDITLRALDILAAADIIAAEDTRTARKLMEIHGIALGRRKLVAFHDHSKEAVVDRLVSAIARGQSVACVSEAGMPLIADPGFELARAVRAQGLPVTAAPGASAVLTALAVGDIPTDRFAFLGFLPATQAARKKEIARMRDIDMTLVVYESPKRLSQLLQDLRDILGPDRPARVCRELTKRFEEVVSGTLESLAERFAQMDVKGEIVVLIGAPTDDGVSDKDVEEALREALEKMRVKDAANAVAGALGLPRRDVYQIALRIGGNAERD